MKKLAIAVMLSAFATPVLACPNSEHETAQETTAKKDDAKAAPKADAAKKEAPKAEAKTTPAPKADAKKPDKVSQK